MRHRLISTLDDILSNGFRIQPLTATVRADAEIAAPKVIGSFSCERLLFVSREDGWRKQPAFLGIKVPYGDLHRALISLQG